jgi:hypothetical protein
MFEKAVRRKPLGGGRGLSVAYSKVIIARASEIHELIKT